MVRKSKGRQKVEMVKMANDSNLQVTFSKRRSGLFKKASELCTLCGAEIAIIVFSPGRKIFSFGHPGVESVIDRYLTRNPTPLHQNSGTMQLIEAHRNANVRDLNAELTQATSELEKERKRGDDLNKMQKAVQGQCWWEAPIDEMEISHCQQLAGSLEGLMKVVNKHVDKLVIQNATNANPFFAAGSSSSHPTLIPNAGFAGMPVMPPHANPHAVPLPPPHAWNPVYGRFF